MVAFDYARPKSTAERLIARYGFPATLIFPPELIGDGWNPELGEEGEAFVPCTVVETDTTKDNDADSLSMASTRSFLVAPDAARAPETDVKLGVGGAVIDGSYEGGDVLTIQSVKPLQPGGVVLLWEIVCRGR